MANEQTVTSGEISADIYKQQPGADIEPGWWVVVHPPWWDLGERDFWIGPCRYKREALRVARANLKWPPPR